MEPRTTTSVTLKSWPVVVVLKRNSTIVVVYKWISILMSVMMGASIESWPIEAVPKKGHIIFFAKKIGAIFGIY